jgi:creatinine amidohydrolase/Fe(II)-dependent formamide hydrolase-like protein
MSERVPRRFLVGTLAAAPLAGLEITRADSQYVHPRKVLLWESTRKEFREALEGGSLKAMIVPAGSTEQHNEHLAMIHDTASVTLVAQQAALALYPQVMVATPVAIGISPHWMDRKGTLSLRQETFLAVVFDICDSLKTHGVKTILILNGHGGNGKPLAEAAPEFRQKLGINVQAANYWDAYTPEIIKKYMESNKAPAHAAEFETSFAMAAFPERIHWEDVDYAKAKPRLAIKDPGSAKQDEQFHQEAKLATTWKGEAMIRIAVEWTAGRLREMIAQG